MHTSNERISSIVLVLKSPSKKTPPKSTYTPNNSIYLDDSLSLNFSPVKGEKNEAVFLQKIPGIYESMYRILSSVYFCLLGSKLIFFCLNNLLY